MRFIPGDEGVHQAYLDTLNSKTDILAILQRGEVDPKILRWLRKNYTTKRAQLKIKAYVIIAEDDKSDLYVKESKDRYREVVSVPLVQFPIKMEVNIYDQKIAFMSFHKDAPHFGVIIDSPYIADTIRALWKLAWVGAHHLDHSPFPSNVN